MVEAVTDLVFEFLIKKNYITDRNKAINGGVENV
jgi:hypothetical protein